MMKKHKTKCMNVDRGQSFNPLDKNVYNNIQDKTFYLCHRTIRYTIQFRGHKLDQS